jgi:hypothetical protein
MLLISLRQIFYVYYFLYFQNLFSFLIAKIHLFLERIVALAITLLNKLFIKILKDICKLLN